MPVTEIRGDDQIKALTITNAEIATAAAIELSKLEEAVIQADGGQDFTGEQSMGSNKLTNLDDGTDATDAVNLGQLQAQQAGLSWKDKVRATTTVDGALATAYEDGDVIDGVTLATGDRILIKNQSAGAENGIYDVAASGAPTRSTDADTGAEVESAAVFVAEGTLNADAAFVQTTEPITIDVTAQTWVQFSGLGQITAGSGLSKTGNTINVGAGNGITVNADDVEARPDSSADSIDVIAGGIKIKDGADAQILVANGSGVYKRVTMSGDATIDNAGVVTVTAGDFVVREVPSGAINGVNTTFTLADTPIAGSEELYLNGILQNLGGSNDYTISGATITMNSAPKSSPGNPDVLLVSYRK